MGGSVHWGLAGSEGTLPSWHWRAASPGGELAPIRAKLQLNYFSYTGIIPISSSHLMLSLLFCLGSICPEFFLLLCWGLPRLKASPVLQVLCIYLWVSLFIRLFRILKQFMGSSFLLMKLHLWCRSWMQFFACLLSPAPALRWLQAFPESCCSLSPWSSLISWYLQCHMWDGANVQAVSLHLGERVLWKWGRSNKDNFCELWWKRPVLLG